MRKLRGCLDFKNAHSSLKYYHLSLYNSSLITEIPQLPKVACLALFPTLITQKILLFVGPTDWLGAAFTSYFFLSFFLFFFLFFLQPPIPKLIEPRKDSGKRPTTNTTILLFFILSNIIWIHCLANRSYEQSQPF